MTVGEAERQTIAIGGFMGVGKSTLGPIVAARLGLPFVDLDRLIEAQTGQSCAALLREQGEASFRRHETRALKAALDQPPVVVSLGGGTLHEVANRALLGKVRVVVLWTPLEELLPRLATGQRPLASDAAALFAARASGYRSAGTLVDVGGCSPREAAARVLARLEAG